ncbi:MAG: hypothetical protein ACFFB8_06400 [Promethearchaeota archaeon]
MDDIIRQMLKFILERHIKGADLIRALEIATLANLAKFKDLLGWA